MTQKYMAGLMLAALAASTGAQAAPAGTCLSVAQAEALVTYLLPTAVQAGQTKCATTLPASAALMQKNSPRLAKYRAASEGAWRQARSAVTVLAGDKLPPQMDDSLLRPIAEALFSQIISNAIQSRDCSTIAKIYQDLEPLPSANLASVTVAIAQAAKKDGEKPDLPICKAPA